MIPHMVAIAEYVGHVNNINLTYRMMMDIAETVINMIKCLDCGHSDKDHDEQDKGEWFICDCIGIRT